MNLVFVHDHRFVRSGDTVYSAGQFPARIWERYLSIAGSLTVISREGSVPDGKSLAQMAPSSHPRVRFLLLPNLSSPRSWLGPRQRAKSVIREALREADALIARLPSENGFLAAQMARELDKPWAVELAGCAWDGLWNYGGLVAKFYAPVRYWRMRRTVAQAPSAYYVTEQFLQRRYPNRKGHTIACSDVEIETPQREVLEKRLARIEAQADSPVVFGLIGTLSGRFKGIQTVLAALPIVRQTAPHVVFRILGPGNPQPWQAEAEKLGVADLVRFDGLLPPGDPVMAWLDAVDVYLQPSLKEGLPRALIEALSRACPAIGSTCAGIPELLDPACLIKPGDHQALAQLMLRAATDRPWQAAQARRNWETAGRYSRALLDSRRAEFWQAFAQHVREGPGQTAAP